MTDVLTVLHRPCQTHTPIEPRVVAAKVKGIPIAAVWCAACQRAVSVREVCWPLALRVPVLKQR